MTITTARNGDSLTLTPDGRLDTATVPEEVSEVTGFTDILTIE